MSRSSIGLLSAVAPSAVKQAGGVTNQLSSMQQWSGAQLQSLRGPGGVGAEPGVRGEEPASGGPYTELSGRAGAERSTDFVAVILVLRRVQEEEARGATIDEGLLLAPPSQERNGAAGSQELGLVSTGAPSPEHRGENRAGKGAFAQDWGRGG